MVTAALAGLVVLLVGSIGLVAYFIVRRPRAAETAGGASSGWEYVVLGAVLSVVSGAIWGAGIPIWVACIPAFLGGVCTLAGAIAIGVVVGMRRLQTNP